VSHFVQHLACVVGSLGESVRGFEPFQHFACVVGAREKKIVRMRRWEPGRKRQGSRRILAIRVRRWELEKKIAPCLHLACVAGNLGRSEGSRASFTLRARPWEPERKIRDLAGCSHFAIVGRSTREKIRYFALCSALRASRWRPGREIRLPSLFFQNFAGVVGSQREKWIISLFKAVRMRPWEPGRNKSGISQLSTSRVRRWERGRKNGDFAHLQHGSLI